MKVLVTYYSQTHNTEKIAKAMYEEAAITTKANLKKIESLIPGEETGYDFIFIGSPLHAGNLAAPVKDFLAGIQTGSGQKIAAFITHSAPAYPDQEKNKFIEPVKSACQDKGIEYKGCFNCQGALTESLHQMVKEKQNLNNQQWENLVKQMTGRPNEHDEENAREFVNDFLG